MSKHEKLLGSIRNNPLNVRFDDACTVAISLGFEKKGGKGSHVVFGRNDTKDILNFQNHDGKIPAYQARQLIKMIEKFGRLS
ncbi:MAG: type II toxin-antitoxin system HicA family toxin [Leptospirales bacterium]